MFRKSIGTTSAPQIALTNPYLPHGPEVSTNFRIGGEAIDRLYILQIIQRQVGTQKLKRRGMGFDGVDAALRTCKPRHGHSQIADVRTDIERCVAGLHERPDDVDLGFAILPVELEAFSDIGTVVEHPAVFA